MQLKFHISTLFLFFIIGCQEKVITQNQVTSEVVQVNRPLEAAWQADWICSKDSLPNTNAWISFRKKVIVDDTSNLTMRLAVDSKYWLYVNDSLVVFEGGLKRGPSPEDTYYDQLPISEFLIKGENTIAILLWYFGKEGMSHKSSGQPGLIAEIYQNDTYVAGSDRSWKAKKNTAYISESEDPQPNWRLPESNIVFNANQELLGWHTSGYTDSHWENALVLAKGVSPPWNQLQKRPIPFWKDFGLKEYKNIDFPFVVSQDTVIVKLPYNMQFTPYFKVKSKKGEKITILTNHYYGGSAYNMRAEYITKEGEQEYESFGWINGEEVYYIFPKGTEVLALKYRETGYDTEFAGSFQCDRHFYNTLWEKARRTLYITMRDTYMDCPDRERAQWWGDVVLESGEAFYALDRQSDALAKKGIFELMNWQRNDSTIFSPIPSGNWNNELPTQMLSSIGIFGFWNYYWHTGDKETIEKNYEAVKEYINLWKLNEDGTLKLRKGGWTWGDWGENKDMALLFNTQYYMALDSYARMSQLLGKVETYGETRSKMEKFKKAYNQVFWRGNQYRSKEHFGKTDDRSQALSVVAGLADSEKFQSIYTILKVEQHASPYMEKYVLEALFQMGYADFALQRMEDRFGTMVNYEKSTTLWEGWGIGEEGYGGGTTNHAWSGGGLTLLSQYVAGIYPTSEGYKTFQIKPQLGFLKHVKANVSSIKGNIFLEIDTNKNYEIKLRAPKNSKAKVFIPEKYKSVLVNGQKISLKTTIGEQSIELDAGTYFIQAKM